MTPDATLSPVFSAEVDVLIDSVGAQGDGVAAGPIFVPLTLPGERVRASVHKDRGELEAVLAASPDRVAAPCPHFGACGGCALQHWASEPYLAWKRAQIIAALARERIETEVLAPFAAPPGSRRRVALHARKVGRQVVLGYKARRSWSVVEITACTIADPRLVRALSDLANFAAPLFEHAKSAPTLHVTLTDTGLDVDVTGIEGKSTGGLSADRRRLAAEAARAADFARATLAGEMLYQAHKPMVRFGRAQVALPAGGFLQAVASAEAAMAEFACDAVKGASRVADLFCGSGAFTFRLAEIAGVTAIDSSDAAIAALKGAVASAPGQKPIMAEARDLYRRPFLAMEMKKMDAVIFDPPRAGAPEQAGELARSKVARAVAVSCNLATFARDARTLCDGGFRLTRVLPVDQFLWSPHIELVGVFER
jgi:23S rRNA (uracil1939-C5)-methyltransferase